MNGISPVAAAGDDELELDALLVELALVLQLHVLAAQWLLKRWADRRSAARGRGRLHGRGL